MAQSYLVVVGKMHSHQGILHHVPCPVSGKTLVEKARPSLAFPSALWPPMFCGPTSSVAGVTLRSLLLYFILITALLLSPHQQDPAICVSNLLPNPNPCLPGKPVTELLG